MASFSSNELNYLVWRYLQESGFSHTAFLFRQECNLSESEIDSSGVAVGSLPNIVQKGLYYVEAELCSGSADDMEKAMVESLSLLEAVNEKPPTHKVQARVRQEPSSSQQNNDISPRDAQRERDREARANNHNGVSKKDRISPRNNGILGVHSKKQHAAQQAQASLFSNGDPDRESGKDELESLRFPKDTVRFLKCHNSEVFICAWNPNSDLMASGSGDSTTRIWDLSGSEDPSTSDSKFERSTRILKHSTLNGEKANDPPTNKVLLNHDPNTHEADQDVTSLDWNHSGEMLATGCYDGFARIWTRDGPISWDRSGQNLALGLKDGSIPVWKKDGNLRCSLGAHKGPIFALKWNNRSDYILSAGVDKTTIVWDAYKGTQLQQFCFHSASALDVDWINNDTFASCSTDKTIHVCQLNHPDRPVRTYTGHNSEVNAVKYDPHSHRLASCSDDMTLRIWSLDHDNPVHVWRAHQKEIYTIRWSPQGHILASASFDHTVRLWDVRRGEAVRSLTRHSDPVYSVSFSPDGKLLASGCFDRSVFIWDIHNGKLLQSYIGDKNQGGIFEVSWNYRGDKVAASASDGTVILMDVRHLKNRLV